jgi:hypothetical protein
MTTTEATQDTSFIDWMRTAGAGLAKLLCRLDALVPSNRFHTFDCARPVEIALPHKEFNRASLVAFAHLPRR